MSIDYRQDNTIIFTLARMNPPTPGHLFLIRTLIVEAVNKNIQDVYVFLSKTNDNKENPIPCPEKINVLGEFNDVSKTMINSEKQKMFDETSDEELKSKIQGVRVHTICVPDIKGATPFTPLYTILGEKRDIPDLNLFLIIGDDRKNMLDSITDFFFKWDNVNSVDGIILPREEMSQYKELAKDPEQLDKLNMTEVPINAISASFVRNIVKNHRPDKFQELYSPFLDDSKIPNLYDAILHGIETLPINKKPDSPSPQLKYRYPMIKGVSTLLSQKAKDSLKVKASPKVKDLSTAKALSSVEDSSTAKALSPVEDSSTVQSRKRSRKSGGKKSKYIKKRKTRKMKKTKKHRK